MTKRITAAILLLFCVCISLPFSAVAEDIIISVDGINFPRQT